jgi:hypothetical protein
MAIKTATANQQTFRRLDGRRGMEKVIKKRGLAIHLIAGVGWLLIRRRCFRASGGLGRDGRIVLDNPSTADR